ncbi:heme-copper oxidase family protein [Albibacterium indicum]|uniref:hypothetical protein n=1 Tax=Albibacterium indicum TaxID=2292082 RepID=UPI000E4B509B|nr:hypothetical protein [Pedobacter indicus]
MVFENSKTTDYSSILPFYGTASVFFLFLTVLMFIAADRFETHFFKAETLALVHLAVLGWGTMIIFGAAYQLIPVIFGKKLYSSGLAYASFWFLLFGTLFLAFSFWGFLIGSPMVTGGSMVLISIVLYNINVIQTSKRSDTSIQRAFLIISGIWLLLTASIGLLLAVNLYIPFLPTSHMEVLKIHAHMGFVGWFLQLITGVSSKLVPMFLFGKSQKEFLLRASLVLQNIGLVGFVVDQGLFGSSPRMFVYFAIVVCGMATWFYYLVDVYRNRVKKKVDMQMKYTFISLLSLTAAIFIVPVLVFVSGNQWSILYGIFIILGWVSGIIFGKTFKTLPFIIWNKHYENMHGRKNIPLPKHLYNEKYLYWQFVVFVVAFVSLCVGVGLSHTLIIKIGLSFWILVAILYNLNVAKVFFHKPVSHGTST